MNTNMLIKNLLVIRKKANIWQYNNNADWKDFCTFLYKIGTVKKWEKYVKNFTWNKQDGNTASLILIAYFNTAQLSYFEIFLL